MLSFFAKKKHNVEPSPGEHIQSSAADVPQSENDDFIFIEQKKNPDPAINSHGSMYPQIPPAYGQQQGGPTIYSTQQNPVPYVQDVPFVLAPQLCKTNDDLTQTQVDGILALLTRQLSVDGKDEYNFALEHSIVND